MTKKKKLTTAQIKAYFVKDGWRIKSEAEQQGVFLSILEVQSYIDGGLAMDQWKRFSAEEQVERIRIYTQEFINKCKHQRNLK